MQAGVEHDDGEAEHVAGVGVGEDVRVELAVPLGEGLLWTGVRPDQEHMSQAA